jgi:hypothetical protein
MPAGVDAELAEAVAAELRAYLESGSAPPSLFTDDVFCDFTFPLGRAQASGRADTLALRRHGHPSPGVLPRWRVDAIATGFVLEFEERWQHEGQSWYSREMLRAELRGTAICALSVYCTGDWDEQRQRRHRDTVVLIKP